MQHSSLETTNTSVQPYTLFDQQDIELFQQGSHTRLYQKMGSHPVVVEGIRGMYFSVWAPAAESVSVIGDFNGWKHDAHMLLQHAAAAGIWEGFIPAVQFGTLYKYHIVSNMGIEMDKGDPYAHYWELRPATASITCDMNFKWNDGEWMKDRMSHNSLQAPWSVYEVHLLSWMRPDKNDEASVNTYSQAIELLVPYVKKMGFTHVEFMPIMEHPFDGSWGYQGTGFFAPTSRFGNPHDFMQLIEAFHQSGIGVILDWVPSHFPYDAHGLYMFDGTHAYENDDMRKGYHPDWNSYIFNYGKPQVTSFLISSACFWLDIFHADALRVDGVSSILFLDYSRGQGQWEPNINGGNTNLEAIALLQTLNETVSRDFPDVQVIAEESTAWQGVTKPVSAGGLGFGMKWMMGWMHDTLEYFKLPPDKRIERQDSFTLSMEYFYQENFMLALSHDEVVYGKQPMLGKMPGNEQEQFANLRLLYTYMFSHPGTKLLFMGDEFGSTQEWNYKSELPWNLLQLTAHRKMQDCVSSLCSLLKEQPALYELQFETTGFEWIERSKPDQLLIAYRRKGNLPENDIMVVLNLGPEPKNNFSIKAAGKPRWSVLFSSDERQYGGNTASISTLTFPSMPDKNNEYCIRLNVPAYSALLLK